MSKGQLYVIGLEPPTALKDSAQLILFPDAVEGVVVRAQHVHDSTKGHDSRLATVFLHNETFMSLDCKEMIESLVEDDVAAIWQGGTGSSLE